MQVSTADLQVPSQARDYNFTDFFILLYTLLCLQSLEVDTVSCLRNTHPAAHDRIFKNTSSHQVGNDQVVEAMCAVVLEYLFHEAGITANVDGETFSEILGDLLYDISREKDPANNSLKLTPHRGAA